MKHETSEPISETEAIRSEIEQTRESMDQTIDKIGERMKPRHLLDDVLDFFRSHPEQGETAKSKASHAMHSAGEAAGRMANGLVGVVRQHPIPTILIGAGIAWAIIERNRGRGNGHGTLYPGEPEEQTGWSEGQATEMPGGAQGAKEAIGEAGEKVQGKFAAAGQALKEKGQRVVEGTRSAGRRATEFVTHGARRGYEVGRDKFLEASDAHPLSVGVGFLAAGVLTGLALPRTSKEDQWVGSASDRAKGQVRAKAQQFVESGKRVASAAAQAAKETAKETAAQEGLTCEPKESGQPS